MWNGRDIDELRRSVYGNFFTDDDLDIIQGLVSPDRKDVVRLINKADKYGDIGVVYELKQMYNDILNEPEYTGYIPPREETEARKSSQRDFWYDNLANDYTEHTRVPLCVLCSNLYIEDSLNMFYAYRRVKG